MVKPTEVEGQVRSAGRLFVMAVAGLLAFWLAVLALTRSTARPAVVPCPPAECTFHPHAPHGPGPGMTVQPWGAP
jgi:hypothetical protein